MILAALALAAAVPEKPAAKVTAVTPMAARVVTFAALNKRNGRTQVFTAKPGEQVAFDTLTIRVRACETTPPWEQQLTGAFLQIDDTQRTGTRRVYSGWMFAESSSLHPLEHGLYDVWVRSCTMSFPGTGPDTVVAGKSAAARPSSAKKSPGTDSAPSN